jgi:PAS domain S-box-containing protein
MSDKPIKILLVEDNPADANLIKEMLADATTVRFDITHVMRLDKAERSLAGKSFDVIILDLSLPDGQGLDTFVQTRIAAPGIPIIVMSGLRDEETAIKAVQEGAQDYLVKGHVDSDILIRSIRYAIERKHAEEELQWARDELEKRVKERTVALEKEHAFRETIEESILAGIAAVDLDGRQTYVNRAFCQMVGWSEEELIGATPPFVYWPSDEIGDIMKAFRATLEGNIPYGGFELRFKRRNGEIFYVLVLVSPLRDSQGRAVGWVASVGDITARKKAEEALRKSEASLSMAQRIAHLGNWEWDLRTNKLYWSDEIYRIFGLTPQEFGATYEAFLNSVHPDDREFVKKAVNEALYGMPYSIDHRIILPDCTVRIVHEQGEVTFGESGEPIRMFGTVHDITERKEAEKALQDSREKYSAIVKGFDGFIYIYSENHDLEFMNERLIERIGYNAIGQKCYKALDDLEDICQWCETDKIKKGGIVRGEIRDQKDNRWYYVVNTPIHNQDGSISRMAMIQDITEKKENEIRLIMSERLAALGQMASGIAHEINNPLASIAACAEGLLNRLRKGRSDIQVFENYLKIIDEEVIRCKGITTSMLSFVKETTYEKKNVDINYILDKTLELISFQGRLKDVEVIKEYKEIPMIYGSEGELRQVFLIFVMNALDAMEDRGTITLETGIISPNPSLEKKGRGKVFIKVSDTGSGIPSEFIGRIFDPFFTTKSEKGGTGLGLSIASKIISDNNGNIDLTSQEGKGTTFKITLPV